ncbi:MAG: helix-turn-helix transcriptional regulator [Bacteroidota bacterium]
MIDRILELLKEKKLSPSQFADEIGIQRSGMSHLISGRNKPSLEFVIKLLKRFPDVSPGWLLNGTEDSKPETQKESGDLLSEPGTLFDDHLLKESKPAVKQPRLVRKEKSEGRIEKIVIFYDDRTFREYEPEKYESGTFSK